MRACLWHGCCLSPSLQHSLSLLVVSMTDLPFEAGRFADAVVWTGAFLALATAVAVCLERGVFAFNLLKRRRIERFYGAAMDRALGGEAAGMQTLAGSPLRHRVAIAWLLVAPLVDDRDPERIARTRQVVRALMLAPVASHLLSSRRWWRRALAFRTVGLLQLANRTPELVGALDDPNAAVRAAAVDAIADLRDPATLEALVVRLHDESQQPGRVAAALAAFGTDCEPFLLEMADVDDGNRLNYARALSICGTSRARPVLCRWTADPRPEVRAAAFEALGHVGADAGAAALAIHALDSADVRVRAMAAFALHGWTGTGDAVSHLAKHLDDAWPVAVHAAQSLQTMQQPGVLALQASASRPDLAGVLARQTLWEMAAQC
jgi:HEAT repeats